VQTAVLDLTRNNDGWIYNSLWSEVDFYVLQTGKRDIEVYMYITMY